MDAETAFKQWAEENKHIGTVFYLTKKAFMDAYTLGAHSEAEIWSKWILSRPHVEEYWNLIYGGGEFSADDAATLVDGLINGVTGIFND